MSGIRNGQRVFQGERLLQALDSKFISQSELAREMEIPEKTVTRWRQGRSQPRMKNVRRLAEVLDVEPTFFYEPSEEAA